MLAARERLDLWADNLGAIIDAMGIAIDPPFEVDDSVIHMRARVERFMLQNVGLGGREHSREDDSLEWYVSGVESTVREEPNG